MEITTSFVAFIDILGFKGIVERERESGYKGELLDSLFDCHVECQRIFGKKQIELTQFSDSIVISKLYNREGFDEFVSAVSMYQKHLIKNGFLCRGGIVINKHYSTNSFIFSPALIDAYLVESEKAIYPRVVVSSDVVELLFPDGKVPNILIKEYDGLHFVNYLEGEDDESFINKVSGIVKSCIESKSTSIIQKGIWLANYCDRAVGTSLSPKRFS